LREFVEPKLGEQKVIPIAARNDLGVVRDRKKGDVEGKAEGWRLELRDHSLRRNAGDLTAVLEYEPEIAIGPFSDRDRLTAARDRESAGAGLGGVA
jgi:hypothetical protein